MKYSGLPNTNRKRETTQRFTKQDRCFQGDAEEIWLTKNRWANDLSQTLTKTNFCGGQLSGTKPRVPSAFSPRFADVVFSCFFQGAFYCCFRVMGFSNTPCREPAPSGSKKQQEQASMLGSKDVQRTNDTRFLQNELLLETISSFEREIP